MSSFAVNQQRFPIMPHWHQYRFPVRDGLKTSVLLEKVNLPVIKQPNGVPVKKAKVTITSNTGPIKPGQSNFNMVNNTNENAIFEFYEKEGKWILIGQNRKIFATNGNIYMVSLEYFDEMRNGYFIPPSNGNKWSVDIVIS